MGRNITGKESGSFLSTRIRIDQRSRMVKKSEKASGKNVGFDEISIKWAIPVCNHKCAFPRCPLFSSLFPLSWHIVCQGFYWYKAVFSGGAYPERVAILNERGHVDFSDFLQTSSH